MTAFCCLFRFTHLMVALTTQTASNFLTIFVGAADTSLMDVFCFLALQEINQSLNLRYQLVVLLVHIALIVIFLDLFDDGLAIFEHDISSGCYLIIELILTQNFDFVLYLFCNNWLCELLLPIIFSPIIIERAALKFQKLWRYDSISIGLVQLLLDSWLNVGHFLLIKFY